MAVKKSIDELLKYHQEQAKKLQEKKIKDKFKKIVSYLEKNHKYFDDDFLKKVYEGLEKHVNLQKEKKD